MKVLMFGWEFPPNISGGLGTACYGITKSLSSLKNVDITFVMPKTYGNENPERINLIGANQIDLIKSKIHLENLKIPVQCIGVESNIKPYTDPKYLKTLESTTVDKIKTSSTVDITDAILFSGKYGSNLMDEIHNFSVISEYIAQTNTFDVIHAHDWLTFPAGITAKKISGKPLVVHVHATDFDRSGGIANPAVYKIEKAGMEYADSVICVSNRTRDIVIRKYHISAGKCKTVHNGVEYNHTTELDNLPDKGNRKYVTFLGRITIQKGPEYFIRVAELVIKHMKEIIFIMAGDGDMYHEVIRKVAASHLGDHFLFTGFLKGSDVCRMLKLSDIFVMPSVSEPFGICPLEAMQNEVPSIISKQSGVSEVVKHAIKVDFWDIRAMADAIHAILSYPSLSRMMIKNGKLESANIKWEHAVAKIHQIYQEVI